MICGVGKVYTFIIIKSADISYISDIKVESSLWYIHGRKGVLNTRESTYQWQILDFKAT